MPEMVIIAVIALIIFGPRKLPELGKSLGKSIAEFKRASNELKNTLEEEIRTEELQEARKSAQIPPGHASAGHPNADAALGAPAAAAPGTQPTTATPASTPSPTPVPTTAPEGETTPRESAT
jgi:TatA/E family protein of Tat protein translocase